MEISIIRLFRGLYRLCQCGCGILIKIINKKGILVQYKQGHYLRTVNQTGFNNPCWRGGRTKIEDYWYVRIDNQYLREHVYFYEQKNKLCMLHWGDVHHIDPNMDDRWCSICGSYETAMRETKMGPRPNWYGNEIDGFECKKCYLKKYSKQHYEYKKLNIDFVQ